VHAPGPVPGTDTWVLRLRDRPGSLERLLSTLRRRMVPLEALSLARAGEGELEVELTVSLDQDRRTRIIAEVEGMADMATWIQGPGASAPEGPTSHTERTEDHATS
jgi:acetolactate synthase regulatory subunit